MRIRYADVAATLALVLALSGTAYAVSSLPRNSVGTPQLKAGAVTKAKLGRSAVDGRAVKDGSLSLSDLVGIDITGKISFAVGPTSCTSVEIGVRGATKGQAALVTFTSTLPTGLMAGDARVTSARLVEIPVCNLSTNTLQDDEQGIRVVTFG